MDYLQQPVACSESLFYVSKVNIYLNQHVSGIRMTSPCVIVYEKDSKNA